MLYYLTPEAAQGFVDKDKDGDIELGKANRDRFGGKAIIYPMGVVPEGPRKGLLAYTDSKGEGFPAEDTTAPVAIPEPEPSTPVGKRTLLGCNIGAGGMGKGAVYGTNYVYPTTAELELAAEYGMEMLRVPYRLYRIFDPKTGAIDPNVPKLIAVLDKAEELGFTKVVLSDHGFGKGPFIDPATGNGTDISVEQVPAIVEAFTRAFGKYIGKEWFVPSFVNEPHYNEVWYDVARAFIAEMRKAGWTNTIVISRNGWAGLHSLSEDNADQLATIVATDPLEKIVIDMHQYVDSDSSGTHYDQVMGTKGTTADLSMEDARKWLANKLGPEVAMLRARGLTMLLGEWGIPNTKAGAVATEAFIEWLDANSDVIVMAAWWVMSTWMIYDKTKSFYGLSAIDKNAPSPHLKRIAALRKV